MSAPLSPSSLGNGLQLRLGSAAFAHRRRCPGRPRHATRQLLAHAREPHEPPEPAPRKPESAPGPAADRRDWRRPPPNRQHQPEQGRPVRMPGKPAAQDGNSQAGPGPPLAGPAARRCGFHHVRRLARQKGVADGRHVAGAAGERRCHSPPWRGLRPAKHGRRDARRFATGHCGQADEPHGRRAARRGRRNHADATSPIRTSRRQARPPTRQRLPFCRQRLPRCSPAGPKRVPRRTRRPLKRARLQLTGDGGRKSLQNSALLPKTELSAGRSAATPVRWQRHAGLPPPGPRVCRCNLAAPAARAAPGWRHRGGWPSKHGHEQRDRQPAGRPGAHAWRDTSAAPGILRARRIAAAAGGDPGRRAGLGGRRRQPGALDARSRREQGRNWC